MPKALKATLKNGVRKTEILKSNLGSGTATLAFSGKEKVEIAIEAPN